MSEKKTVVKFTAPMVEVLLDRDASLRALIAELVGALEIVAEEIDDPERQYTWGALRGAVAVQLSQPTKIRVHAALAKAAKEAE